MEINASAGYGRNAMKLHRKTLFLYYDPHYVHDTFAKAIGTDYFPAPRLMSGNNGLLYNISGLARILVSTFTIPRGYEVYLCEATYIIPVLAKKLHLIKQDAKIINICSNPLLYYIKTGVIRGIKRRFALWLLKGVDGFICVGEMEKGLLLDVLPHAKAIVTYSFIRKDSVKSLSSAAEISPNLASHKILLIGKYDPYYKGVDILVAAFKKVRSKWPDAELNIVGKMDGAEKYVNGAEGVNVLGHVKDLTKMIKGSALYVHMGRGDAFAISTQEAMLGGLPTIVSDWTGTKEIVGKVAGNMVVPLDKNKVAAAINKYFSMPLNAKTRLSTKFIHAASELKEDKIVKKFVKDYQKLLIMVNDQEGAR